MTTAKKKPHDNEAMACECEQMAAALGSAKAKPGEPQPVGAGDLGIIRAKLTEAAQFIRAGNWLSALDSLWAAAGEARKAFAQPAVFGAAAGDPVKGHWADTLKNILALILKFLPLIL